MYSNSINMKYISFILILRVSNWKCLDAKGSLNPEQQICPDPEILEPCECLFSPEKDLYLRCYEQIKNDSQLIDIFRRDFPTRNFYEFTLNGSPLKSLGNFFNGASFRKIYLENLPQLESISADWLESSRDKLSAIIISNVSLSDGSFPFESVESYTKLTEMNIDGTHIETFPALRSNSLVSVGFQNAPVLSVPSGTVYIYIYI